MFAPAQLHQYMKATNYKLPNSIYDILTINSGMMLIGGSLTEKDPIHIYRQEFITDSPEPTSKICVSRGSDPQVRSIPVLPIYEASTLLKFVREIKTLYPEVDVYKMPPNDLGFLAYQTRGEMVFGFVHEHGYSLCIRCATSSLADSSKPDLYLYRLSDSALQGEGMGMMDQVW